MVDDKVIVTLSAGGGGAALPTKQKQDFWLADVRLYFITSQSKNGGQLWGFALLQNANSILILDCKNWEETFARKENQE